MKYEYFSCSKDELLSICYDYNLPVSPSDSVQTLQNYLKAAKDEAEMSENKCNDEYTFLENDPVYIGKYNSRILNFMLRLLPI